MHAVKCNTFRSAIAAKWMPTYVHIRYCPCSQVQVAVAIKKYQAAHRAWCSASAWRPMPLNTVQMLMRVAAGLSKVVDPSCSGCAPSPSCPVVPTDVHCSIASACCSSCAQHHKQQAHVDICDVVWVGMWRLAACLQHIILICSQVQQQLKHRAYTHAEGLCGLCTMAVVHCQVVEGGCMQRALLPRAAAG